MPSERELSSHDHTHHKAVQHYSKALVAGIVLNSVYIIVEVIYGVRENSMALISDAGHNLSDVFSLALSLIRSQHGTSFLTCVPGYEIKWQLNTNGGIRN
jgi:Co/Zn/Cd efflux system component